MFAAYKFVHLCSIAVLDPQTVTPLAFTITMLIMLCFQEVAKHTQCNLYHSELQKTLFDSCISQFTGIRDLNCGLATLRFMVENFMIFLVTESGYSIFYITTLGVLCKCMWWCHMVFLEAIMYVFGMSTLYIDPGLN